MAFVIRADRDYWSNTSGWTKYKSWATFFDTREEVEEAQDFVLADFAEVRPYVAEVPNATAGYFALQRLMQDRDGDEWGWAMSWLFAICDAMTFDRDMEVPAEWDFRPSPLGKSTDDEWKDEILVGLSDNQLAYVGNVLHRYTEHLRKAGKDY